MFSLVVLTADRRLACVLLGGVFYSISTTEQTADGIAGITFVLLTLNLLMLRTQCNGTHSIRAKVWGASQLNRALAVVADVVSMLVTIA